MITVTERGHGLGWRRQLPSHKDYRFENFVRAPMKALPTTCDNTHLISTVKDQGQLGACVAGGTTSTFEATQIAAGVAPVLGCRLLVYRDARIIGGDYPGDNGCNIRDGIQATVVNGVAPETDWPYDIGQFDDAPPPKAVSDAVKDKSLSYYLLDSTAGGAQTLLNIKTCLAVTGLCVDYGMPVYAQYEEVGSDGIINMPDGNEIGGHCNMFCGYSPGYIWTLNDWGEGWGKAFTGYGGKKYAGGIGLLPEDYVKNYCSDCWTIATESQINPTPPTPTHVTCNSSPMLMANGDRFVTGSDKAVWQQHANAWASLGGVVLGAPFSCTDGTNVDVFAVGSSNNAVYWKRNATAWVSIGGVAAPGTVPTAAYVNGVLTVNVEGTTHAIYEKKYVGGKWPTLWTNVASNLD